MKAMIVAISLVIAMGATAVAQQQPQGQQGIQFSVTLSPQDLSFVLQQLGPVPCSNSCGIVQILLAKHQEAAAHAAAQAAKKAAEKKE